jgi:hypothetical protein
MGHQSGAGDAAVAVEVNEDGAFGFQNLGSKGLLVEFEHAHDCFSYLKDLVI